MMAENEAQRPLGRRTGFLRIVNWRKCQRYTKANPPWIKLYTSLASDDGADAKWQGRARWLALGPNGQALLVNLWLYAAMTTVDGRVWGDPAFLSRVLPYSGPIDLEPLLAGGFIEWEMEGEQEAAPEPAADPPASPGPPGPPESETPSKRERESESESEGEAEAEGERESVVPSAADRGSSCPARARSGRADPPNPRESRGQAEPRAGPEPVGGPEHRSSALPLGPPVSDALFGPRWGRGFLPGDPPWSDHDARMLGDLLPDWAKKVRDPWRDEWCRAVFEGLKLPYAMESLEGRQELGAFAALYDELQEPPLSGAIPQEERDLILAHDVAMARKKGRWSGGKGKGRKGAVFVHVHYLRVIRALERLGRDDIIRWVRDRRAKKRVEKRRGGRLRDS